MSRKGCSPDNSRTEGFGRLKVELFYGRGWDDVGMGEFMKMLYAYLVWYRDKRCKSDLGYMSPMQYRRSLGLWSGKDKLDFLLRILKRIAARIPLETCSPGWNACAPYCNRALCT